MATYHFSSYTREEMEHHDICAPTTLSLVLTADYAKHGEDVPTQPSLFSVLETFSLLVAIGPKHASLAQTSKG